MLYIERHYIAMEKKDGQKENDKRKFSRTFLNLHIKKESQMVTKTLILTRSDKKIRTKVSRLIEK